jgi:pimeloyl-ACP methyl ester carboxylesterase
MKRLVLFIFFILCAPASASRVDGHTVTVYQALSHTKGRVVLLHGFTGNHNFFNSAPSNGLLYNLRREGYQVVTPDLPDSGPRMTLKLQTQLVDGGVSYLHAWQRYFHHLIRWSNRHYGRLPTGVGGISWGGYHAMQAACHERSLKWWFVISPVVDPARLGELASLDTSAMSLDHCVSRLSSIPANMSFGDVDQRVGVIPQQRLSIMLLKDQAPIQIRQYRGLDHTTTRPAIDRVVNWLRKVPWQPHVNV